MESVYIILMKAFGVEAIKEIPAHLKQHTVQQEPELYTPMDHAEWRFIMKISKAFFKKHAHEKYLQGLEETGISTERIPLITEMDEKLGRFGWRAVGVAGFIPPAAFLEFLSLGILPIACDMRKFENIAYTPAPDIVHESAGHAPIIADPDYAKYLHHYGEIARRVIFSHKDISLYEAIRLLSDTKEDPHANEKSIRAAQDRLEQAYENLDIVSEATQLGRMGWWSIEYGLVGSLEDYKIYGAGLLSSVGESYNCLSDSVKKLPFGLQCVHQNYDITRPQPQLFVAESFEQLREVLAQFAKTLAYTRGGREGMNRALESKTVCTVELNSGVQLSGLIDLYKMNDSDELEYIKMSGPCQVSYKDNEIRGFGAPRLRKGFISPTGRLKGLDKDLSELSSEEFKSLGLKWNHSCRLEFESGFQVEGVLRNPVSRDKKRLALEFSQANVKNRQGETVVENEESLLLLCGKKVSSVFGGSADRSAYVLATQERSKNHFKHKSNLTEKNEALNTLYKTLREMRESGQFETSKSQQILDGIKSYPEDWLIRFEILELKKELQLDASTEQKIRESMERASKKSKATSDLIFRGLALLD